MEITRSEVIWAVVGVAVLLTGYVALIIGLLGPLRRRKRAEAERIRIIARLRE